MTSVSTLQRVEKSCIVAIYSTHMEAENAVKELAQSGVDMKTLSIVGRDYHTEEHAVGYYTAGDRMKAWGSTGAFWGGLWGFMFGGFFFIPGLGALLVAGPLVAWLAGALEGALVLGGMSVLGAAFLSVGIPEDSIVKYEVELNAGRFLLLDHGSREDVSRSKSILAQTNPLELKEHAV